MMDDNEAEGGWEAVDQKILHTDQMESLNQ